MTIDHRQFCMPRIAAAVAALSLAAVTSAVAAQGMTGGGTGGGSVSGGAARSGPALTAPAGGQPAAAAAATPTPSAAAPLPGQSAQPSQLPPLNANGLGGQPGVAAAVPGTLPSRVDTAASAFRQLDRGGVGYVTRADTDRIPGFVGFDNADSNRDGQLSAEEFNTAWRFYSGQ